MPYPTVSAMIFSRNRGWFRTRSSLRPDQITGIRGLAGTGKSRTLKELLRAFDEAGRQTVSCAPTGSAAENLRRDGLPAITHAERDAYTTAFEAIKPEFEQLIRIKRRTDKFQRR